MFNVRKVVEDLYYVGVDENRLNLFENIHPIKNGVSYNSYVLLDEKTVLFDTVDWAASRTFLQNVDFVLAGKPLDYVVVNHVEPDHAASLGAVIEKFKDVKVISTAKAFAFMEQFGFTIKAENKITVKEGDTFSFGKHCVTFAMAPMVHWPEVMVTFDTSNGVLFSADAFGTFGALNGALFNDEVNFDRDYIDDARRYYTNIVGKFGVQVQAILKKASQLPIKMICPLHGPIWRNNLEYFIDKHDKWSSYTPEENGTLIVYGSMYGSTEQVAIGLASKLYENGYTNVKVCDVSSTHVSELIAYAFKYSNIVIACPTYNLEIYPPIHAFMHDMKILNLQNRTFAFIENGTWASTATKQMTKLVEEMKNMKILTSNVSIKSTGNKCTLESIKALAKEIVNCG